MAKFFISNSLSFEILSILISETEYLFEKHKSIHLGEVGYFLNCSTVSSPPRLVLHLQFGIIQMILNLIFRI